MAIIYEWNASERTMQVDFGLLVVGVLTGIVSSVVASVVYDKYLKKHRCGCVKRKAKCLSVHKS